MRKRRPGTAGEDGGKPVPFSPEPLVAERKDTAVEPNESSVPHTLLEPRVTDARGEHLRPGNNAELPCGHSRQTPILRG